MKEAARGDELHINLNDLPPERAVGRVIEHAASLGASDLFLITNENHLNVSARLLGIPRLLSVVTPDHGRRCIAHLKAVAGMDVAERRRPLDGRWLFPRENAGAVDLRISCIPTLHGEDVTLRLTIRETRKMGFEALGLLPRDYNQLLGMLSSPSGLILVTGPTGSGKTTTLYTCLAHLNNGERKINTIEDPVEYAIEGIRQSQINPRIDVGFAELLRGVLRQAPDVIMVGEIRDAITAETAVRAANSGHLVLTTLHAPIAAGAIQSMLTLGVHPPFLAGCLRGAVAQRLVRTLCPRCKTPYDLSDAPQTFDEIRHLLEPGQGRVMYGPRGCPECHMMGYGDRTGVFEVLPVSSGIRKLIMDRQNTQAIRQKAVEEGMVEFRHSALLKVARGETSIEEVYRVVPTEYLGVED